MSIILHDYQVDLKNGIIASPAKNTLGVLPCGGGKTVIMADLNEMMTGATCTIAHRQELVLQISMACARAGTEHRIIAPSKIARFIVEQHIKQLGRNFYNPHSDHAVAGVDTIIRHVDELRTWANQVRLWQIDECFPAGTLVDGIPIEMLRIGNEVTAFNEKNGKFEKRKIVRLFKNPIPSKLIRLKTQVGELVCTVNHPIWTSEGWKTAYELYDLWWRNNSNSENMFRGLPKQSFINHDVTNQSQICFESYESTKSYDGSSCTSKNDRHTANYETLPNDSRRKRCNYSESGTSTDKSTNTIWLYSSIDNSDKYSINNTVSLQTRYGESSVENKCGSRRVITFNDKTSTCRLETRSNFEYVRLESAEIFQSSNFDGHSDGYVYNLEVDELHTYTTNGFVVHNCHHVLPDNKWGRAVNMFPAARGVGWTATPCRTDKKPLRGIFGHMVIGPDMRTLIKRGFLTPYRIFGPPESIDIGGVPVAAGGDFSNPGLRAASHRSKIVGDIIEHYQRIAPGKRGVTFVVDVDTAEETAAAFRAAGVPALTISERSSDKERIAGMDAFRRGDIRQIVNVDIIGEGFDLPSIEVVSLGRPTMSYGLHIQQSGRALRRLEGKSHGIIIDHAGNVRRHGLPDTPREWSLDVPEKRTKRASDGTMTVRTCLVCFRVFEPWLKACPDCGTAVVRASRGAPEQVDGDLTEYSGELLASLGGEAARIMEPWPYGRPETARDTVIRSAWMTRQDAQQRLRTALDWYGGYMRDVAGASDAEGYRRFYHTFGIDVLTAQGLNTPKARELESKIMEWLNNADT